MKRVITIILTLIMIITISGCRVRIKYESNDQKETTQTSSKKKKEAIDFTKMESQEAYDEMVKFMKNTKKMAGTPIKVRGTVASTEFKGGSKWYSVMVPGKGGYESGPHFLIEGYKEKDYPATRTVIEISGVFDLLEGVEDPTLDDYYVMVKPKDYVNVSESLTKAVVIPKNIVSKPDTKIFEVKGLKMKYLGMKDNVIMFNIDNSYDKEVTLNGIDVKFNGKDVNSSFWINMKVGEKKDTEITVYPVTLEKAGITQLEALSFQVRAVYSDKAEVRSGEITIQIS